MKDLTFKERYFHKLTPEQRSELERKNVLIQDLLDHFKQPDWCGYPNALSGLFGCWALHRKDTEINQNYCKGCDKCKL